MDAGWYVCPNVVVWWGTTTDDDGWSPWNGVAGGMLAVEVRWQRQRGRNASPAEQLPGSDVVPPPWYSRDAASSEDVPPVDVCDADPERQQQLQQQQPHCGKEQKAKHLLR